MAHLARDVRFGLRLLSQTPAHTVTAVLALALGIAANTAIFSIVYATLLAPSSAHTPKAETPVVFFMSSILEHSVPAQAGVAQSGKSIRPSAT